MVAWYDCVRNRNRTEETAFAEGRWENWGCCVVRARSSRGAAPGPELTKLSSAKAVSRGYGSGARLAVSAPKPILQRPRPHAVPVTRLRRVNCCSRSESPGCHSLPLALLHTRASPSPA